MLDVLERKLRQMHLALGAISSTDPIELEPVFMATEAGGSINVDFNGGMDPSHLANSATLLIANIASLKDHLKAWCKRTGASSPDEALVNSNRAVALVHDLWNVDKHGELNRPPRSGVVPTVANLRRFVVLPAGATSGMELLLKPQGNGQYLGTLSPTSAAVVRITGMIVDQDANPIGDLYETCKAAAEAWEEALASCGVSLPES